MEGVEDRVEHAAGSPSPEVGVDRLPGPEPFGQVPPRRSGLEDPHQTVEHQSTILGRATGLGPGHGKERFQQLPFLIANLMTLHRDGPPCRTHFIPDLPVFKQGLEKEIREAIEAWLGQKIDDWHAYF